MHTYIVQFLDATGSVLDTQYVTARGELSAKTEAYRKTNLREYSSVEASRM